MESLFTPSGMLWGRPLEALIYLPVFIGVVYSFYKYWETYLYRAEIYQSLKIDLVMDTVRTAVVIIAVGYLLHPLLISTMSTYIAMITLTIAMLAGLQYLMAQLPALPLMIRFMLSVSILTGGLSTLLSALL